MIFGRDESLAMATAWSCEHPRDACRQGVDAAVVGSRIHSLRAGRLTSLIPDVALAVVESPQQHDWGRAAVQIPLGWHVRRASDQNAEPQFADWASSGIQRSCRITPTAATRHRVDFCSTCSFPNPRIAKTMRFPLTSDVI